MTIALVVPHPATMPGYNNSVDLDEVHSLSRYCFLYSIPWEACICFTIMLRENNVSFQFRLSCLTGYHTEELFNPGFHGTVSFQGYLLSTLHLDACCGSVRTRTRKQ